MKEQAALLIKTGFLPSGIKTSEQAIAIMLKGRELDIGPMQAFSSIAIIQGKPAVSPELMLMLILKHHPKTKINYVVYTNEECQIEVTRPGQDPNVFTFNMDDAKKAGLSSKDNWKKYPRAMLRSRCIAEMARSLFPDAIAGCSDTPDELGATTNEDQTEIRIEPAARVSLPPVLSLNDRINKMVGVFAQIGIDEARIENRLCHPLDDTTESELGDLQKLYRACKADPGKKLDYFPEPVEIETR
jgi:hypothetical protein